MIKDAAERIGMERIISIISPILVLLMWEFFVRNGVLDKRFFPAPSAVLETAWEMVESGELWNDLRLSLLRVAAGFVIAAIPGILLGVAMGLSPWIRAAINPLVAAVYPIPKSAMLPLLLLVFGLGESSKIAMVTIGSFFLVLVNSMAGVMNIERVYFEVAKTFGAKKVDIIRTVAFPGALPLIMAGLRLGFGMGLIFVVLAEFVGSGGGIGYMIWRAWQVFAVERLYVGLLVVSVMGYVGSLMFEELERIVIPWKR